MKTATPFISLRKELQTIRKQPFPIRLFSTIYRLPTINIGMVRGESNKIFLIVLHYQKVTDIEKSM